MTAAKYHGGSDAFFRGELSTGHQISASNVLNSALCDQSLAMPLYVCLLLRSSESNITRLSKQKKVQCQD